METKWHRETIEALGMYGKKTSIINKLNKAYAHTEDKKLRDLIKNVQTELLYTSNSTDTLPVKDMRVGVPTARVLYKYCEDVAFN